MNKTEFLNRIIKLKRQEYGDEFDASELDSRFAEYWFSKDRIKVSEYGINTLTGTVGMTTGWKPAFLLMLSIRSVGSSIILDKSFEIIAVKKSGAQRYRSI